MKTILDPNNEGKITARSLLAHPWIRGTEGEAAPRIPISKPTPSFVTPTRELADASNYARNFSELARLVTAKVQSRQMRLAIPFGGGNLGQVASANVPHRPDSAAGSRPGSALSNGNAGGSPGVVPARPASRLSVLSHPTDDDMDRSSFESDGTAVGMAVGSSSMSQSAPPPRERKKGGLKKLFSIFSS